MTSLSLVLFTYLKDEKEWESAPSTGGVVGNGWRSLFLPTLVFSSSFSTEHFLSHSLVPTDIFLCRILSLCFDSLIRTRRRGRRRGGQHDPNRLKSCSSGVASKRVACTTRFAGTEHNKYLENGAWIYHENGIESGTDSRQSCHFLKIFEELRILWIRYCRLSFIHQGIVLPNFSPTLYT